MFKLAEEELQIAFEGIEHHGFSALFPNPLEWEDVKNHWPVLKKEISGIDLDTYTPTKPLRIYAPKNRFNLRVVTHLHPLDLLIYTALVFIVRDDIEKAKVKRSKKRVFSYRADTRFRAQLYQSKNSYQLYKKELIAKAEKIPVKYIAVADIADFYPQIKQHRLKNIIEIASRSARGKEVARILEKFLLRQTRRNSYGIPVGPYASRVLAEALMIDVDRTLLTKKFNFIRWVDDFVFFCRSDAEAQHALFFLAQWLYEEHGLTLHGAKTKIIPKQDFIENETNTREDKLNQRENFIKSILENTTSYEEEDDQLDEETQTRLESVNLKEMLVEAIEDKDIVDYEMVTLLLGRISRKSNFRNEWRLDWVNTVLENIEHLYPISDSVANFFASIEDMGDSERKHISRALLKPIFRSSNIPPPEYYVMWVLNIFATDGKWNNADEILRVFFDTESDVCRRYAALALSKVGERSHALALRNEYDRSSPLVRLAILKATLLLGGDERRHWKKDINLNRLEKLI